MKTRSTVPWVLFTIFLLLCAISYTTAGTVAYTYDDAGRLIKADYGDGKVIEYTYDKEGNLLQIVTTEKQQQYTLTIAKTGTGRWPGMATSTGRARVMF